MISKGTVDRTADPEAGGAASGSNPDELQLHSKLLRGSVWAYKPRNSL